MKYPGIPRKVSWLALVGAGAGLLAPSAAVGQARGPGVRLRLAVPTLQIPSPAALRLGGVWDGTVTSRQLAEQWVARTLQAVEEARFARRLRRVLDALNPPLDTTSVIQPLQIPLAQDTAAPRRPSFATLAQYADLNIELDARLETRFDQLRNLNCTQADISNPASGCRQGFPIAVFEQQFALRAGGVLGERLNVNVDFDSQREFNANNTINVWYQGLEDEVLRRVEVGNLDFRLPSSRFIASSIPAKSFGVQAEAQVGPLEFRAILAQQKGSSVRAQVFTVGEQATQVITRASRDVEFEDSRFFFVASPTLLPTFPNVDVLNIVSQVLPPELQIAQVRVYRLRGQSGQAGINPSLRGIDAVATREDSPQSVGPFFWDLLIEGQDYYLDPSGLWFGLRNRVSLDEFLAVSYVTVAGDTVGTFPAVDQPNDTLRLIHEPRRGTEVPTFFHEMRNFYRIGGAISRNSIELALLVNDSERPLDGVGTYINRLGLATATDPSLINEFNRVFPRERDPNGGLPLRDLFVVFPHLQPFADSVRLLEGERNDSLYRTPTYLRNTQGPAARFRFAWEYQTTGSGDRSQLNLGAFQLRSGSERLRVGNRDLLRGRDYEISYDLGIVTFLNPDSLFPGPTEVQVQFEQNQLFDVAPSTVFGFQSTYSLGSFGRIDGVTLFQAERTVFTRPELGFEPQSMFLGGLSTELRFQTDFVTRALDALPLLSTNVPSTLEINGEIATSRPNPNQTGQAYLEEFEGVSTRFLALDEQSFQLGSRPLSGRGLPPTHLSPFGEFATEDATTFVWQNVLDVAGEPFEIGPSEIDSSIVLTGTSVPKETLLWFSLKPDTIGGAPDPLTGAPRWFRPHTPGPRWRSITTPLDRSGLGVDLSRVEFLEFWALEDLRAVIERQEAVLVFDFGTIMEDAVGFGPDSFLVTGTDTVFSGFQQIGLGELDSERDQFTAVFNADVNDIGIHGDLVPSITNAGTGGLHTDFPVCERVFTGVAVPAFPLGDLGARCTRVNGFVDSEDLNGDNRLDLRVGVTQEDVIRYVVPLGDPRFVVRIGESVPRAGQSTPRIGGVARTWRLYRIPFRQDTVQFGTPNIRQVRSLRVTMVTPEQPLGETEISVALARVSFVGAPWLKRAETPIAGLGGLQGQPHGEVVASTISTADNDLGYTSPPGVIDAAAREGAASEFTSQEINERSLRLIARDLRLGERAEAFRQFSDEADKNFLQYRALRAWARGRGPGWEAGDLEFFIKVGSDENNFYLYHVPARSVDWEPEVVVEIDRWLRLRTEAEQAWLSGAPPSGAEVCGGDSTAFVRCDGPYLVQVRDPAVRPPNLARVSEIAVGMLRVGQATAIPEAELWVDDIRLSDVVGDPGVAGYFEARLAAADFAEVEFSYASTDDRFRQIDDAPDYLADTQMRIGSTVRLDKLLPESWGMSVPFSIQHQRVNTDPFFVQGTDILADALDGLRKPSSSATSMDVALRRSRRGDTFAERLLIDPLALIASKLDAENVSELSVAQTSNRQLRAVYDNRPAPHTIPGAPAFFVKFVDGLPGWIRNSEFGRALRSSRLRWNPYQVRASSGLVDNLTERLTFRVPVALPQDSMLVPLRSVVHSWRNTVGADLRPFSSLGLRVDYMSTRDLQDYGDSTLVGRLTGEERGTLFGKDIGFERDRTLGTRLTASPVLNSWFRPRYSTSSTYVFHRDPNGRVAVQVDIDSVATFRIPEAVSNFRRRVLGATLDIRRLAEVLGGPTSTFARVFRGLFPADISFQRERRSTFDRITFVPDLRYRLGLGNTDEFRAQDGDLALSAVAVGAWTVAGGTRLPLGFGLRLDFRRTESTTWARRGESQAEINQLFEQWPSGSISWVYTPPAFLRGALSGLSAQARYRRTTGSSFQPGALQPPGGQTGTSGAGGVFTENLATNFTPTITLTWVGGVVTTGQFSRIRSEVLTSGNVTLNDERSWGGSVDFSFRAPTTVFRLPNDVRTTLRVNATDATLCQQRAESPECAIVSDSRRRQVDVRLDTGFPPSMRGGASFSYVLTEERHTSSKFTQMVFTIFLDINFLASQVRR